MDNQTKTRATVLNSLKEFVIAIFGEKEEPVANCLDDIENWKSVVNEKESFSESDREKINEILKAEKELKERKQRKEPLKHEEQFTEKRLESRKMKIEDKEIIK